MVVGDEEICREGNGLIRAVVDDTLLPMTMVSTHHEEVIDEAHPVYC